MSPDIEREVAFVEAYERCVRVLDRTERASEGFVVEDDPLAALPSRSRCARSETRVEKDILDGRRVLRGKPLRAKFYSTENFLKI